LRKLLSILVALLGWAASLSIMWSQPAYAQSFLAIQKQPVVVRKHFCEPPPPVATGDRWSMDDSGNTFWSFTIKPVLDCDVISLVQFGNAWRAQVSVKSASVRIGLLMDIYLGEHPTAGEVEHQEGYALICERFYKNAEPTLKSVWEAVVPEKISATGPDADTAVKNAIAKATNGLAFSYFMNSSFRAQRVGRAYDMVCAQTSNRLGEAVNLAFFIAEKNQGAFNKSMKQKVPLRTRPPALSG
jgi:hypothetical protein